MDLQNLYRRRFYGSDKGKSGKEPIWKALCAGFFNKRIRPGDSILEIGAGYCEFINNVEAKTKYALDLNPDVALYAAKDVNVIVSDCLNIEQLEPESLDVIFISNFLEHMPDRETILKLFRESRRLLKSGGG